MVLSVSLDFAAPVGDVLEKASKVLKAKARIKLSLMGVVFMVIGIFILLLLGNTNINTFYSTLFHIVLNICLC